MILEGDFTLRTEMRAALNDLFSGQCGLVSVLRTWLKGYAVVSSLLNPANGCF